MRLCLPLMVSRPCSQFHHVPHLLLSPCWVLDQVPSYSGHYLSLYLLLVGSTPLSHLYQVPHLILSPCWVLDQVLSSICLPVLPCLAVGSNQVLSYSRALTEPLSLLDGF